MLRVFAAMCDVWGCRWTAHLSDATRSLKLWTNAFCDLTDDQIEKAFDTLSVTLDFPPSIAKFRRTALDVLQGNQAFELAKDKEHELHKIIGSWAWRNLPEKEIQQRFIAKYRLYEDEILSRCNKYKLDNNQCLIEKTGDERTTKLLENLL